MKVVRQIARLLSPHERRKGLTLLAAMLLGMVLETFSLSLVVPAVVLLLQRDLPQRYPMLAPILARLGNPTHGQLVVGGMLVLATVYVIKTLFLIRLTHWQTRYAFRVQARLSRQLYETYLRQPYTFHLQRNSGELIQVVVAEVSLFTFYCMLPGLLLLTEGLVLVGTVVLLFVVEPVSAMVLLVVFGGSAWLFQRVTRARNMRWGEARQHHETLRTQDLKEGLGGVKEIRLLGRESFFLERFDHHNLVTTEMWERQHGLQHVSRLGLELMGVVALTVLVLTMLAQGREMAAMISSLGLFAAAAFRLMPSANRMLNSVQSIHYGLPAIGILERELAMGTAPPPADGERRPFADTIDLREVTYTYPEAPGPSLRNVSLTIRRSESVGFVGPSGSGKSTIVDVILGLLAPQTGEVLVDGRDITADLRGWQDQIGYVPQSVYLMDESFRRNVAFGLPDEQIDEAAVQRAIRAAQLEDFVAALPQGLDTVVGERGVRLSGGQRQRIGIARALYRDPAVLVLDEATSALDTQTERGVMEAVNALHGTKTVIIVAHRLSTVERCDRIYRLDTGRVVEAQSPSHVQ